MNSTVPDLTTIILNLLNQHCIFSDTNDESRAHETTATTATDQDNNQLYYFIVFNNPTWSKIIQKRRPESEQQHQQEIRKTTDSSSTIPDKSVDEEFIAELRKLINKYIQRTTRPFPLRYFIDLSHQ